MSYLTFHHHSFYFQIRVPAALVGRFGPVVRINLQTADRAMARPIALRLASDWLARFAGARADGFVVDVPALMPGDEEVLAAQSFVPEAAPVAMALPPTVLPPQLCVETPRPGRDALTDASLFNTWNGLDRDREPSTVREMRAALRDFRRTCKVAWSDLTRQEVAAYRDHLLAKRFARATVGKKVGFISTLLQVGVDAGLLPLNPARGLKIPKAQVPTIVRRPFSAQELERLFQSSVYTRGWRPEAGGGEACAWLPMIALATGARLEEIAQLRVIDIYVDPSHGPLMRLTDEDPEQRLKTEGSRRIVPLHAELVRAGLLEYVDAAKEWGSKWLFPALEPDHDGRRGGNFGKWFQRFLRASSGLGIRDSRLVFHSFRHTFKTLCRAAMIPEDIHDALTGHVSSSVSRKYGEMPLAPLVTAVAAVKLPVALPRVHA